MYWEKGSIEVDVRKINKVVANYWKDRRNEDLRIAENLIKIIFIYEATQREEKTGRKEEQINMGVKVENIAIKLIKKVIKEVIKVEIDWVIVWVVS